MHIFETQNAKWLKNTLLWSPAKADGAPPKSLVQILRLMMPYTQQAGMGIGEISQAQEDKCGMISLLWETKKGKLTEAESRMIVAYGKGRRKGRC